MAVLKSIEQAFKKVIEVATATVRRVNIDLDGQGTGKRLNASGSEVIAHQFAKQPPLPADQSFCPDSPPVVIDRRREWQLKDQRFHGATAPGALALAVRAGASRFV